MPYLALQIKTILTHTLLNHREILHELHRVPLSDEGDSYSPWHVPELLEKREKIETLAHLPSYLTQTHTLSKRLKAVFSNLPGNNKCHEGL